MKILILLAVATVFMANIDYAKAKTRNNSIISPVIDCEKLIKLRLPNVQILKAEHVSNVPAHCHVLGVIDKRVSEQDPNHFTYGIGFELNLPDRWVGRFELMGGGGTDGNLRPAIGTAGTELASGWAVASNDGGHEDFLPNPFGWISTDPNAGDTSHFGLDAKAREDFGYNAFEKTAKLSKFIISFYYGQKARHSYFWGCSNGGREAMLASQRFPKLFDGIMAANPGFDLPKAAIAEAWNEQTLATLATRTDINGNAYIPDTFPLQDQAVAAAAILSACDKLDGLVDGIIDNYSACTNERVYPALETYTCSPAGANGNTPHGGSCLTSTQVEALKKIYDGPKNSKGEALYTSWYWDAGIYTPPSAPGLGWAIWNVGTQTPPPLVNNSYTFRVASASLPMLFMNPPIVTPVSQQPAFLLSFDFDKHAPLIFNKTSEYPKSAMEYVAATSTNLSGFKNHGGKIIIYNSVNDGVFSSVSLVDWYKKMNKKVDNAESFSRLYLVPNMAHCGGGPATSNFSAQMLDSITKWVEGNVAPDRIVAANMNKSSPFPSAAPFDPLVAQNFPAGGTRPLCPFPKVSRYKGEGATNVESSFECVMPEKL